METYEFGTRILIEAIHHIKQLQSILHRTGESQPSMQEIISTILSDIEIRSKAEANIYHSANLIASGNWAVPEPVGGGIILAETCARAYGALALHIFHSIDSLGLYMDSDRLIFVLDENVPFICGDISLIIHARYSDTCTTQHYF